MNVTSAAPSGATPAALEPVRKTVLVEAPQALAFDVFTARLSDWWPMTTHHIGKVDCTDVRMEPGVGGRCYEVGVDGSECDWGRVLAWEPPHRLVWGWELNAHWAHDRTQQSQVEVRFTAIDPNRTRVDLEHRGFEVYGTDASIVRDAVGSSGGWSGLLEQYARSANAARAR
jgi:uncharacterized protein YndB with AHSA1/START domain